MKKGLVLEGGAMRGLFSAGVMDVLMEAGIKFDCAIGVSAGAAFGCNYKSRQPGRVLRYNLRFAHDDRYCSFRSLRETGNLYNAEFCYHTVPAKYDVFDEAAFEANPMEFYVVCTDVATGKPVYKRLDRAGYEAYEWIRASASMPLAAQPVKLDGMELLDGGMTDSIPLRYSQEQLHCCRNVVILTQPLGYVKPRNKAMLLIKAGMRHYPAVIHAMEHRHEMYNAQTQYVRQQEQAGCALVLRPGQPLGIKRVTHSTSEMKRVYSLGRDVAMARLGEVQAYLNS